MPEINNETLIIAIQAVASELRSLRDAKANGKKILIFCNSAS
jgi:hypothetical protein